MKIDAEVFPQTHFVTVGILHVSQGGSNRSLKNYGFICDAICSLVHMHTKQLD